MKKLEKDIASTEEKIDELTELLDTKEVYTDSVRSREVYEEKEALEERLMKMYEEWEELTS